MRMRLFICLFVFVLSLGIISGCAGLADYEADLPGGYSIVRTSAHSVFIAPKKQEKVIGGASVIPTKRETCCNGITQIIDNNLV